MSKSIPVITIDGPGGVGKGTISRLLAKDLQWHFLDSGALYRVLALAALHHEVALDNEDAVQVLAEHLDVQFIFDSDERKIILEGEDVTHALMAEQVGQAASKVACLPGVRKALLLRQQAFLQEPGLVADGRDMGTVVFPKALLKIYLTASAEIRAQRRHKQLKEQNIDANIDDLLNIINERDKRDSGRSVAPLQPAENAITVDTSALDINQVMEKVKDLVQRYVM